MRGDVAKFNPSIGVVLRFDVYIVILARRCLLTGMPSTNRSRFAEAREWM